jgi:hypothetical protein
MVLNPISHAVGLPDVDSGEVVFLITNQNVNTGSTEPERCRTSIDLERGTATSNPVYSCDRSDEPLLGPPGKNTYRERDLWPAASRQRVIDAAGP